MGWVSGTDVERWFTYRAPDAEQIAALRKIREVARYLAQTILENTPPSADQSAAIRKVREAVMVANAAIVTARPARGVEA